MELPTADDDHSHRLKRILENSLQEILGEPKTDSVLSALQVCDRTCISHVYQELRKEYGENTADGIMLRVGQSAFKYTLMELGAILGLDDSSFRLLSSQEKLMEGIGLMEGFYSELVDVETRLEYCDSSINIHMEPCLVCNDLHSDRSICSFTVGLLQEFTGWAGSGC